MSLRWACWHQTINAATSPPTARHQDLIIAKDCSNGMPPNASLYHLLFTLFVIKPDAAHVCRFAFRLTDALQSFSLCRHDAEFGVLALEQMLSIILSMDDGGNSNDPTSSLSISNGQNIAEKLLEV